MIPEVPSDRATNRLPISHPEYRFPDSTNPYWTKLREFEGLVYSDHGGENYKSRWNTVFQSQSPTHRELHVEIGCNAGHVILEWAAQNPDRNYVGIDWKFKPIFRAAEKARKRGLKNIVFLRTHAERIQYVFGPQEIDRLHLFFPDPWPKRCQTKNRYFSADRLTLLSELVKPAGIFEVKTDHRGYFDWMLQSAEKASTLWRSEEISHNLHQNHPDPESLQIPEVTLFERIFIKQRLPIHRLKLVRR